MLQLANLVPASDRDLGCDEFDRSEESDVSPHGIPSQWASVGPRCVIDRV